MGQTLTNGIYLPAEGERNCYEGLAANWTALDSLIGGYNVHIGNTAIHVTAEDKQAWNGKADASALTAHTGDTTIHVTAEDKAKWDAVTSKADASALTAHTGDTTIHVTAEDKQAWDGHVADSVKHVTAADKAKWDAVTSKADDSAVVHKSGAETISGTKAFSATPYIYNSDSTENSPNILFRNSKYSVGDTTDTGEQRIIYADKNGAWVGSISSAKNIAGTQYLAFTIYSTDSNNASISSTINYYLAKNGDRYFTPYEDNLISLGATTRRWKSFNGLTPSSLSLPSDRSARIDISSYFTNTGTGQSNSYTVPANGYIYLTLSELTNVHCFSRSSGNVTNYAQTFTKLSNSTGALYVLFPVRKNDVFVTTWHTTTTVSVDGAFFIPCQGNI